MFHKRFEKEVLEADLIATKMVYAFAPLGHLEGAAALGSLGACTKRRRQSKGPPHLGDSPMSIRQKPDRTDRP